MTLGDGIAIVLAMVNITFWLVVLLQNDRPSGPQLAQPPVWSSLTETTTTYPRTRATGKRKKKR